MEEGMDGEDRISRLPESLIHHILSLLPTKCAVATTILSRGWNNLWISLPILDFREWKSPNTQETLSSTNSFMDFVDRVLLLRNMSDIKKFCLTCNGEYFDDQRIKAWIHRAIQCRVEELILCRCVYGDKSSDRIPLDLYTCESLTSLDIEFHDDTLYLPQTILFPRLKILRLSEISFYNEEFTQQLFSGCPVLEELSLKYCIWKGVSFIMPTLKVLTLVSCVRLCGRSLVVDSFPSLVDADIRGMYSEEDDGVDVLPSFVKKLSNVKHLKLSGTMFESSELANALSANFPSFANLITMEVSSIKTPQVGSLFSFLHFSPNLESLVFNGLVHCRDEFNEDVLTLDVMPHCLLMRLKSIKFQNFKGEVKELDLVQLFLQNSQVLETVIIDISSQSFVNSDKKKHTAKVVEDLNKRIMEPLLKCKWASIVSLSYQAHHILFSITIRSNVRCVM